MKITCHYNGRLSSDIGQSDSAGIRLVSRQFGQAVVVTITTTRQFEQAVEITITTKLYCQQPKLLSSRSCVHCIEVRKHIYDYT